MKENLVVVGLDDSAAARGALDWAADYARMMDYRLIAIHVRQLDVPAYAYTTHPSEQDLADADVFLRVQRMYDSVSPEHDWRLIRLAGRPGEELIKRSKRAALLVIGTQGHVGIGRLFEGSVSHYCLRHSNIPVLSYPHSPQHRQQRGKRSRAAMPYAPGPEG
ncbi:MAG TPA: universal stress protein [Microlunatus sp.]